MIALSLFFSFYYCSYNTTIYNIFFYYKPTTHTHNSSSTNNGLPIELGCPHCVRIRGL